MPSLIIVKKPEGVAQTCSVKKLFLEISQNSQENICTRVSFSIKKRLCHRCFPVNFEKFLRTSFFIEHLCSLLLKNLWNIICWSQFLKLNFIKDFKSSFNSLLWNTLWNNWIIYYVSQARKLSVRPVNNCILEYINKRQKPLCRFLYRASEAWIVCRILSKVKNGLKIYIIYISDFGIDISITHVCILMEELYSEF